MARIGFVVLGIEDDVTVVTVERENDNVGRALKHAAQEDTAYEVFLFMRLNFADVNLAIPYHSIFPLFDFYRF
jgi:hypothetical protein